MGQRPDDSTRWIDDTKAAITFLHNVATYIERFSGLRVSRLSTNQRDVVLVIGEYYTLKLVYSGGHLIAQVTRHPDNHRESDADVLGKAQALIAEAREAVIHARLTFQVATR